MSFRDDGVAPRARLEVLERELKAAREAVGTEREQAMARQVELECEIEKLRAALKEERSRTTRVSRLRWLALLVALLVVGLLIWALRPGRRAAPCDSFADEGGEVRTFLAPGQILSLFPSLQVLHHFEGMGPWHRHAEGQPPERNVMVKAVLQGPARHK